MDTAVEPALCIHKHDGSIMKFHEYMSGLYYYDVAISTPSTDNTAYSFVITVRGNKERYHRREIEGADRARELYKAIGRPSQKHFEHILRHNLIRNCPVTVDNARRALTIYGIDVATLKGRSTKTPAQHVPTFTSIPVPAPILDNHKDVTLCIDFFLYRGSHFSTQSPGRSSFARWPTSPTNKRKQSSRKHN
jgi:hypothetical protein